jgi:hypothetical protein
LQPYPLIRRSIILFFSMAIQVSESIKAILRFHEGVRMVARTVRLPVFSETGYVTAAYTQF